MHSSALETLTEVLPDVFQIRLPMTNHRLTHVNGYLFRSDDGCTLVDCGWDSPEILAALESSLESLGLGLVDLRTVVVTHWHSDHYGLAGTLIRRCGASLQMHRLDWHHLRTRLADGEQNQREFLDWMRRNGLDVRDLNDEEQQRLDDFRRFTLAPPQVELEDAQRVDVGDRHVEVVWTPGHTRGHICLYDPKHRALLSGDHVLDPITPNVSQGPVDDWNPLGSFLTSLRKVAAIDADLVLPAHGEPFGGLARRVRELVEHHDLRDAAILDALSAGLSTAAGVARQLPWTRRGRRFDQLGALEQRMALTETLAHLEHLRALGVVACEEQDGVRYHHRVGDHGDP